MYLITGYGSIGSLVVKKILSDDLTRRIFVIDKNEEAIHKARIELSPYMSNDNIRCVVGDVSNRWDVEKVFHHDIQYVVHTAAMKHVTFCEDNPHLASINNIVGINNLLEMSKQHNVKKFINISTDKCAYPVNVMGATKFIAERLVMSYNSNYQSIRLGNVLFSTGSLLPTIARIVQNNSKLKITNTKATRFFVTRNDVAEFIANSLYKNYEGQVLIKKLKSATLQVMVHAALNKFGVPNYQYEVVGLKQGEKMHEHLFTKTENSHMIDHGDYWSIDFTRKKRQPIEIIDSSNKSCLISYDEFYKIIERE